MSMEHQEEAKKLVQDLSEQAERLLEMRKMVRGKKEETDQLFTLLNSTPEECAQVLETDQYFDAATWDKIQEERSKIAAFLAEHIDRPQEKDHNRPQRKRSPLSKIKSHWIFVR